MPLSIVPFPLPHLTGYEAPKTGCGEPIRISEGLETSSEEPETACKGPKMVV